jgi:hypothetical protein
VKSPLARVSILYTRLEKRFTSAKPKVKVVSGKDYRLICEWWKGTAPNRLLDIVMN